MLKHVRKRDGRVVSFDESKIRTVISRAVTSSVGRDSTLVQRLFERVMTDLQAKTDEHTPMTAEAVQDVIEKVLIDQGQAKAAKTFILYRQRRLEVRREKQHILEKEKVDEVDRRFDLNALRVLKARYLRKSADGKLIETPKELFERVAVHTCLPCLVYDDRVYDASGKSVKHEVETFDPIANEGKLSIGKYPLNRYHLEALKRIYDRFDDEGKATIRWGDFLSLLHEGKFDEYESEAAAFYELMVSKRFMPNTPALANFGNVLGMGSACFVLNIDDAIESIMETLTNAALIFKSGGGMGYNFSKLRPEGDYVSSTSGIASGPMSFMKLFDTMTEVIKQGGCVSCDTLIRTDKGTIPIGNLMVSRPFGENPTKHFVYDGNNYNHALVAMDNGSAEVFTAETELGIELKATFNHLVCTVNQSGEFVWKKMSELKAGDFLVVVVGGHSGKPVKIPLLVPTHFNANPVRTPPIVDEDLAELLGIYMADGCTSYGRVLFSANAQDQKLIDRVENKMQSVFGLKGGDIRDKGTYIDTVFHSRDLERYFKAMGWWKRSSPEGFIPEHVMESEETVACAFLRGLFEGDGGMHPDGYPLLYSTSKTLLSQAQQLMLGLGIVSKRCKCTETTDRFGDKPLYKLIVLTHRSIETFKINIGFITAPKIALLEKSEKKAIEYCDNIPRVPELFRSHYRYVGRGRGKGRGKRGADSRYYRATQHYLNDDRTPTRSTVLKLMQNFEVLGADERLQEIVNTKYFYTRIISIGKATAPTMEIEVPESERYAANSILVHNIRRGANMGILNSNHPDIEKFILAKQGNAALKNFNISVLIMPDFWEYYEKDKPYPLVNPRTGEVVRTINAKRLFDMIVFQAWESAEPGVIFCDHANKYNPFLKSLGSIVATNPCGEVLLYPNESCNLGSINVWAFAREGVDGHAEFDWESMAKTVMLATRFLDNVIDASKFPLKQIEEVTLATRKIGLGLMGFGDLLYELGLPYNSQEALEFMERLMEFINYHSKLASIQLAKERGVFPYYGKSFFPEGRLPFSGSEQKNSWHLPWEQVMEAIKKHGIRNSYTTVVAPTGSISMIAGCSSGIEPVYSLVYEKHVKVGSFYYIEPVFEKMMSLHGLYDEEFIRETSDNGGSIQKMPQVPGDVRRIFVTAMDITPEAHIMALAAFQKWVDSSISKTNNFPANATVDDMRESYLLAYKLGCKDVTVFRDTSIKGQVLVVPKDKSENAPEE